MKENNNQSKLKLILKKFKNSVKAPERYLRLQNDLAEENKLIVKSLYDYLHSSNNTGNEKSKNMNLMPTALIIDDMDDEQIWQQLELQNDTFWNDCLKKTAHLLSINEDKLKLTTNHHNEENANNESSSQNAAIDGDEHEDDDDKESDDSEQPADDDEATDEEYKIDSKKIFKKSIVDDNFFNLNEMNDFLEAEDKKEMAKQKGKLITQDDDNAIDYFKSDTSDENDDDDDSEPKYADFYERTTNDKKNETELMKIKRIQGLREQRNRRAIERKRADLGIESDDSETMIEEDNADDNDEENTDKRKVKFDMSKNTMKSDSETENDHHDQSDDDDSGHDTDDNKNKSSHQEREERLRSRIEQLEEKAIADKPWQLKGEINSTSRPQNSLLEEILEFDSTTRPPPIITEQTTLKLEDLIKQRIKDKAWDDVQRKFKPQNTPQEFRKKLVLDQEKSKESLAQIYEREYLQEINKMGGDSAGKTTQSENSEEPKEHTEIRELMKSLMTKLDALSNFYYTPKPMAPEIRIITNIPAIDMEEVAPVAVSDATLLAPEEIRARPKGDVIGKSERNKTDKNRERRHKKLKQKAHKKMHEERSAEREALGLGKHEKDAKRDALEKVLKHRNVEKMKINSTSKSLKSSKAFFAKLQDDTVSSNGKTGKRSMNRKDKDNVKSAKKLKL